MYFEDKVCKVRCVLCDHVLALPLSDTGVPKISNCNVHYNNNKNCIRQRGTMKAAGGGAATEDAVDAEDKRLGLGLGCYYFVNLCAKCLTPWPSGHFSYSIVKIAFEIVAPSNFYF